ncbi:hypothetical protein [Nocardia asiatica]|uniref:hypothetical protein n=1 Tax=Nocardia asiatica TaxID=209252 RepID=UPI002456A32B|nr:hypothetical protein [Nocardia asiatica]
MPGDGYDSDRSGFDSNERGRIFENGADRFFRDRENGYVIHSRTYEVGKDRIQFDKIKEDRDFTYTIEEKSGRIRGGKDEKQLRAVRELLDKNKNHQHVLRSVQGESISKEAQELIVGLLRDFPDQFTHQVIARADAREIWARGRALEQGQQLELPGVGEKARQQRQQEKAKRQEKITGLAKARDRAEKFRKMQQFREAAARGRSDAPQKVARDRQVRAEAERARQARQTPEAERARIEREAAERVAREFPVPSQYRERETADSGEQAAREVADAASVEREAAQARAAAAEREREAASKALDEARNAAFKELDEKGRLSEVERLVWLGQATHPQAAVRQSPGRAPSVERGGTGQGQDRSRNVSRDR